MRLKYVWVGVVFALCMAFTFGSGSQVGAEERTARKSKKRAKVHRSTYTVIPGDTLSKVAKRYGVKSSEIKRWNGLKKDIINVGQKLVIKSAKRNAPERGKRFHTVKAKETFKSIAKKYKVSAGDLISWNPRLDPRKLRVGDKVELYYDMARGKKSGRRSSSRFVGRQMPNGKGWRVRNPDRAWGTDRLVTVLKKGFAATKRKYGGKAKNLVIGDLSTRRGGFLPPHKSHRYGRDADVAYYVKKTDTSWRFIRATPKTLDVAKTWYLLHQFLKTRKVKYIFVNYELQKPLY